MRLWAILAVLALAGPAAAAEAEHGRFHHVHLRVADVARTTAFYGKAFGATPVSYAGRQPALISERAFLFLDETKGPIGSSQLTGLLHVGWAGIDGPAEFERFKAQGVSFHTPLTPFLGGHFIYLYGPDHEVIELWTAEKHHRLNHVHMIAADPRATAEWLAKVANPERLPALGAGPLANAVSFGDVAVHILPDAGAFHPPERTGPIQPTDGAGLDHLAISFADLPAALKRLKTLGVPIERPLRTDPATGLTSFFVRAPNGVLVELIKARPLPDAAWE